MLICSSVYITFSDLAVAMADACLAYFDNAHAMYKSIELSKKGKAHVVMSNMIRSIIMNNKFQALQALAVTNSEVCVAKPRILEACQVGEEMMLLFDQNKELKEKDAYLRSRPVSAPFSMEIDTCQHLARLYSIIRSPENDEKVIKYSERAISDAKKKGDHNLVKQLEHVLETEKARFNRKHEDIREESEFAHAETTVLPFARESYNKVVSKQGENCVDAITHGKNLVLALQKSG